MKLTAFKLVLLLILGTNSLLAQNSFSGVVRDSISQDPIAGAAIYKADEGLIAYSDERGRFEFEANQDKIALFVFGENYKVLELIIPSGESVIFLEEFNEELSAVEVFARQKKEFNLQRLQDVSGTAIYAGKKSEVILVDQTLANLASNNARQIYSQVAGLNIFQNDDAGLQLNIGGRGLDPNRSSNFNTRQDSYDISADVLGYPESYYTPAAEATEQIQIVRGAASLQYGTQFGGLVNFILKKPNPNKPIEIITRNTVGSNQLYTNFTSVSGTQGNWSYYSFFNFKKGDGFRPNSNFNSKNAYAYLAYSFSENSKISAAFTYMTYLAKQAGGLTDQMFEEDPYQSNRARNWFAVDWLLYNLKFDHKFTDKTHFNFSAFGLQASREALGFRTNRVSQIDPGGARDLIKGEFSNYGFEARLLHEYNIGTFLIGAKFYKANNSNVQGPGSEGSDADFSFQNDIYPNYPSQNAYDYPNLNIALFSENIFQINDQFSLTPGARLEYIKTQSDGFYKSINLDGAGNVIQNETIEEQESNERTFVLLGLGASYKPSSDLELYANISQNYRSVTFADISTVNPAYSIDPNINDEKGFTSDLGFRGNVAKFLSFDASLFALSYEDRIGFIQKAYPDGSVKTERTNVGNAILYGLESLFDFNILNGQDFQLNYFLNLALTNSEYLSSDSSGIVGNQVEFVPKVNIKTGIQTGYRNLMLRAQYTYLSSQFSDATNAVESNLSGVIGQIPSYSVVDLSANYSYRFLRVETGVNNLLDSAYFTRRATGYPGPGIIPSPGRNYYLTLGLKF
jgi:Fe(3+) dicitrate transport protein